MSVRLRPAQPTDAGKLGTLMSEAVAAKPWKPRVRSGAEDIHLAGQMVDRGWVTLAIDPDAAAPLGFIARDAGFVHALFIAPEARNRGVGQLLIADAKSACDALELWTFEANAGARRFYQRQGFEEIGTGDGSANDEGLPEVHLRWTRASRSGAGTAPQDKPSDGASA